MRQSYEDFQKIEQALQSVALYKDLKPSELDNAKQDFIHALSHATNIEEGILRVTLE